ncbi:hypothetical protein IIY68_02450 [Candidatus Saccharibacteria bacterium]|nr:hypothetical protein [Candidatus Saccharibacteria bacterium]
MKKHLKVATIAILSALFFTTVTATSPTFAAGACESGVDAVKTAAGCDGSTDALPTAIVNILSAIIGVAGLVSVVYIIIGGVQYMTSSGDASKVEKAKKTILYACIGLIVCALSFVIVNFVIGNILGQQATDGGEASSLLPQPTELPIAFLGKQL